MSDYWDFYLCQIEDQPASIFLDLGLARSAPWPRFLTAGFVRLVMRKPRRDGLSSVTEAERLVRIEDCLAEGLAQHSLAVYVGRHTSNGYRDFFYYLTDSAAWTRQVETLMAEFAEYAFEIGVRDDPEWRLYFDFLYPKPENWQSIRNRHLCEALEEQGDTLAQPRELDHWIYFYDMEAMYRFTAEACHQGFRIRQYLDLAEGRRRCGVQLYRTDTPSLEQIDAIVLPLFQLSQEWEGEYDGWESRNHLKSQPLNATK